jgi:hypothetical protein
MTVEGEKDSAQPRSIPSLRWWIGGILFASTVINYIDRANPPTGLAQARLFPSGFQSVNAGWQRLSTTVGHRSAERSHRSLSCRCTFAGDGVSHWDGRRNRDDHCIQVDRTFLIRTAGIRRTFVRSHRDCGGPNPIHRDDIGVVTGYATREPRIRGSYGESELYSCECGSFAPPFILMPQRSSRGGGGHETLRCHRHGSSRTRHLRYRIQGNPEGPLREQICEGSRH